MGQQYEAFDSFIDASLNKSLNKQSICRLFEAPWRSGGANVM